MQCTLNDIYFVTCKKDNTFFTSVKEFDLDDKISDAGLKDEMIVVEKQSKSIVIRRVVFWYSKKGKVYKFITNNMEISPDTVADIYKHR